MKPEEARPVLEKLKEELLARVARTHRHIHQREEISADFAEQNIERSNDEVVAQLDAEGREELASINKALARIDEDEYGNCVRCGNKINEERLKAIPYTALCINCAKASEPA